MNDVLKGTISGTELSGKISGTELLGSIAGNITIIDPKMITYTGIFKIISLSSTPLEAVVGGGAIRGYNLINQNPYPVYMKVYNSVSSPAQTNGNPPDRVIRVPANGAAVAEDDNASKFTFANNLWLTCTMQLLPDDVTPPDNGIYAEIIY